MPFQVINGKQNYFDQMKHTQKKGFQKKRGSANFIKVCINFIKNMGVSADGNTRKSIGIPFDLVN